MNDRSTLLNFPTDFVIKVFGPNEQLFIDEIYQLALDNCENKDQTTFTQQPSRNKQYLSISVSVHVTSKLNLDKIYQALISHPQVKMVI